MRSRRIRCCSGTSRRPTAARPRSSTIPTARASRHRDLSRESSRKSLDTRPDEDMEGKARVWLAKLDARWAEEYPREEAARRAEDERRRDAAVRLAQARREAERKRIAERDRL